MKMHTNSSGEPSSIHSFCSLLVHRRCLNAGKTYSDLFPSENKLSGCLSFSKTCRRAPNAITIEGRFIVVRAGGIERPPIVYAARCESFLSQNRRKACTHPTLDTARHSVFFGRRIKICACAFLPSSTCLLGITSLVPHRLISGKIH